MLIIYMCSLSRWCLYFFEISWQFTLVRFISHTVLFCTWRGSSYALQGPSEPREAPAWRVPGKCCLRVRQLAREARAVWDGNGGLPCKLPTALCSLGPSSTRCIFCLFMEIGSWRLSECLCVKCRQSCLCGTVPGRKNAGGFSSKKPMISNTMGCG